MGIAVERDAGRWSAAQRLFEEALARPLAERSAHVRAASAGDSWLLEAVLDLLALDERPSPLDRPLALRSVEMKPGDQLDKYRLLERIGAGGMGCVFRAERVGAIPQQVAIKVLHADLRPEVRQRFVQEQRILAGLQHPHIARLHDFGISPSGASYLVMNLVEGISITEYADRCQLSIEERIGLLLQVCDAVRYAHRRLIVHRDLKPANILIDADGKVQLVDFGIAKLLDPAEHLGGDATRTGLRVLTPSYASPEQLLGRRITTGTDVWALGVLLFELLTGRRPFDWSGMSPLEIERRLERGSAPQASAAFAAADEETAERARRRRLDPARLRRRLRSDLDLIVARALAYRPDERYGSVEGLAQDLERHLTGQPIFARPPSLTYRAGKFFGRHKAAAAALGAVLVFLVAFAALQTAQSRRLMVERDLARQERDKAAMMSDLLSDVLFLADPVDHHFNQAARALLDQSTGRILADFPAHPRAQAGLLTQVGVLYRRLGEFEEAEALLVRAARIWDQQAGADVREMGWTLDALGFVYHHQRDPRALPTLQQALRLFWRAHGGEHPDIARSLMHLAVVLRYDGEPRGAEALLRRAIAMDRRLGTEASGEAGERLRELATLLAGRGEREEALMLFDRAVEILGAVWGPRSVAVGLTLNRKAHLFQERPLAEEGARLLHDATEIFRQRVGDDHPLVAAGLSNLAQTYLLLGEHEKAESFQHQAWERDLRRLGSEHPSVFEDRRNMALILRQTGRLAEAEDHLSYAVAGLARVVEPDHRALISMRDDFARLLLDRGRGEEAAEQLQLALDAARAKLGADHWLTGSVHVGLAELALQRGDSEAARSNATEAMRILGRKEVGPERWRLGEARSALGAALVGLGRLEEGREQLEAAVERLRELRGPSVETRLAEARLAADG